MLTLNSRFMIVSKNDINETRNFNETRNLILAHFTE